MHLSLISLKCFKKSLLQILQHIWVRNRRLSEVLKTWQVGCWKWLNYCWMWCCKYEITLVSKFSSVSDWSSVSFVVKLSGLRIIFVCMIIALYEHIELPLTPSSPLSKLDLQDSAPFWLNAWARSITVL